jgi:hypothetical protein
MINYTKTEYLLFTEANNTVRINPSLSYKYFSATNKRKNMNRLKKSTIKDFLLTNIPDTPANFYNQKGEISDTVANLVAIYYGLKSVYENYGVTNLVVFNGNQKATHLLNGFFQTESKATLDWVKAVNSMRSPLVEFQWADKEYIKNVIG